MILFTLRCQRGHEVEAWFRDNAAYKRQQSRGGDAAMREAPAAPDVTAERPPTPAEFRRALQQMRRFVETNCEHVGPRFAEEARKIHNGEAKARGIYGDATEAESQALADDGIEVARIPWVPTSDA